MEDVEVADGRGLRIESLHNILISIHLHGTGKVQRTWSPSTAVSTAKAMPERCRSPIAVEVIAGRGET